MFCLWKSNAEWLLSFVNNFCLQFTFRLFQEMRGYVYMCVSTISSSDMPRQPDYHNHTITLNRMLQKYFLIYLFFYIIWLCTIISRFLFLLIFQNTLDYPTVLQRSFYIDGSVRNRNVLNYWIPR